METGNIKQYFPKKQKRELKDSVWGLVSVGAIVITTTFILNHQQKLMALGLADSQNNLNIYKERISKATHNQLNKKYLLLADENTEIKNHNTELRAKLENFKLSHKLFQIYEKKNNALKLSLNKLNEENYELATNLSRSRAKNITYKARLFKSIKRTNVLKAEYKASEKDHLRQEKKNSEKVNLLTRNNLKLEKVIKQKDEYAKKLSLSKSQLEKSYQKQGYELTQLNSKISHLDSELINQNKYSEKLEIEKSSWEKESKILNQEVKGLNIKISALETDRLINDKMNFILPAITPAQFKHVEIAPAIPETEIVKVVAVGEVEEVPESEQMIEITNDVEKRIIISTAEKSPESPIEIISNTKTEATPVIEKLDKPIEVISNTKTEATPTIEKLEILTRTTHIIAKGDDLMLLSNKYYNTHQKWKLIKQANPTLNLMMMNVGDELIIPNVETEEVVWVNGRMKPAYLFQKTPEVEEERKPAADDSQNEVDKIKEYVPKKE